MLPEAFLQRMQNQLGEEYPAFLESFERPRAVALRFNPLKGQPPVLPFVDQPVSWEPNGFYYHPDARPGLHPYHEAGVYYLQEASAMAPVALLDPQPGEKICDLCAAPGGKTTQIAGRMMGAGFLLSNELHPKRAKILARNVERMGIANTLVTCEHPETLASHFPDLFDRVLVDAPCSGEGMFRKEESAVADWSPETVAMCAIRQAEILNSAAKLVRPGGRLVYSTCTFSPEEDEQAIGKFLQRHPEFVPENVECPWFPSGENGSFRMWPHQIRGEGHFAAVLRKAGNSQPVGASVRGEMAPDTWLSFAQEAGITLPDGKLIHFGQNLCWVPEEMPNFRGLKVVRLGLELGTDKKDRFEPAHALALWLHDAAHVLRLSPEDPELDAYLHGQTLSRGIRGWCLVMVDQYSIGWGKGDGTQLKNHYPKGLRRQS